LATASCYEISDVFILIVYIHLLYKAELTSISVVCFTVTERNRCMVNEDDRSTYHVYGARLFQAEHKASNIKMVFDIVLTLKCIKY